MNTRSIFASLVLALSAACAFGQQPVTPVPPAGDAARADFTPERLQQLLQRYPEADTNKDGSLSAQEAAAYRDRNPQREQAQRVPRPTPTHADVKYGPHERNTLDFWQASSERPTPLLVFIHGGGFVGGDKRGVNHEAIQLCLSKQVSFASINYRYTTQAPYPAPMLDGVRAIQFLRSKSAEWKIDSLRIGAHGGSAGAGIAMWIGFHDDLAKPDSTDPVERESSRLTCVGSIGRQSSYDPLQIREWLGGRAWEHPVFKPFYGVETTDDFSKPEVRKLAHDASVINHLTKDDAPVFMNYAEPDAPLSNDSPAGTGIHHPKFGHILKEKMDALGIEAIYRHASDGKKPVGNRAMVEWLIEKLSSPVK